MKVKNAKPCAVSAIQRLPCFQMYQGGYITKITNEPVREKTNKLSFRPGLTQTGLYNYRRWLEAGNFGFRKKRSLTISVAKTKALISFAVTAKLICAFVFAYADLLVFTCGGSNKRFSVLSFWIFSVEGVFEEV